MQFATYTAFRSAVLAMIDGDDANSGALNQSTLDLLIAMGEQAVYYGTFGPQGEVVPGLRCAELEAPLTLTVASNLATIPADCLETTSMQVAGQYPMDYVAEEGLLRSLKCGGSGSARQYTQQGMNLTFFPPLSDGTTVSGRYYKKQADIGLGTLNAAFNRYPDVWLYAALAESAPFLGEDSRLSMWKAQYKARVTSANRNERGRATNGSRMTVRTR